MNKKLLEDRLERLTRKINDYLCDNGFFETDGNYDEQKDLNFQKYVKTFADDVLGVANV